MTALLCKMIVLYKNFFWKYNQTQFKGNNNVYILHFIERRILDMTKVDIMSGFLGAGKTTLIKKLLKEAFKGEKVVLIENEFGEIGIDGGFLKEAGVQITEMNSGCFPDIS